MRYYVLEVPGVNAPLHRQQLDKLVEHMQDTEWYYHPLRSYVTDVMPALSIEHGIAYNVREH